MRLTPTQNNFSAGEWAPSLYGRSDLSKYTSACRIMKNWTVYTHGGATTRPGTYYIGTLEKGHLGRGRLIPFQFSVSDTYVLAMSHQNMQVIKGEDFVAGGTLPMFVPYFADDLADVNYAQTADTMYLVSRDYAPRKLTRSADDTWSLKEVVYGPAQAAPTSLANEDDGDKHSFCVTATSELGEESLPSNTIEADNDNTLTWAAPPGEPPAYYSIYKDKNSATGIHGWVTDVLNTTWVVQNIDPDMLSTPPERREFLDDMGNPSACAFFEQRMVYGGFEDHPGTIAGSKIGFYDNFNSSFAVNDDEAYEFTLDSRQLNAILWLLPLDRLLIGTGGSEWCMDGGSASDTITPSSVNVRVQSQWGTTQLTPLVVGDTILYVQYGGKKIRELSYSLEADRYVGRDITVLSSHLFEDRTIVDWCHQRTPDSVVWCVMSDGVLLGLTYLKEQEVWAWHQHETAGMVESCCVVPDGAGNDVLYLIVRRKVNGSQMRYIEAMQANAGDRVELAWSLDCARRLDDAMPVASFNSATKRLGVVDHGLETGDHIKLYELNGQLGDLEGVTLQVVKIDDNIFTIKHRVGGEWVAYTEAEWEAMGVASYTGGGLVRKLVTTISGLSHLEGCAVEALADGFVIKDLVVEGGEVTLPIMAGVVTVGLPYTCDLEPMPAVVANQTETSADKPRRVVAATVRLDKARSLQIGPDESRLVDVQFRTIETVDKPIQFFSGVKTLQLRPGSDREGRMLMRVTEPLPTSVLSIVLRVDMGGE